MRVILETRLLKYLLLLGTVGVRYSQSKNRFLSSGAMWVTSLICRILTRAKLSAMRSLKQKERTKMQLYKSSLKRYKKSKPNRKISQRYLLVVRQNFILIMFRVYVHCYQWAYTRVAETELHFILEFFYKEPSLKIGSLNQKSIMQEILHLLYRHKKLLQYKTHQRKKNISIFVKKSQCLLIVIKVYVEV